MEAKKLVGRDDYYNLNPFSTESYPSGFLQPMPSTAFHFADPTETHQ